jgi:hypothetical protein
VLYEILTVISPQSEQGGPLLVVALQVWIIVPTLASGTICAIFINEMSNHCTNTVAPRKIAIPVEYSIVEYGCRNVWL